MTWIMILADDRWLSNDHQYQSIDERMTGNSDFILLSQAGVQVLCSTFGPRSYSMPFHPSQCYMATQQSLVKKSWFWMFKSWKKVCRRAERALGTSRRRHKVSATTILRRQRSWDWVPWWRRNSEHPARHIAVLDTWCWAWTRYYHCLCHWRCSNSSSLPGKAAGSKLANQFRRCVERLVPAVSCQQL